MRMSASVRSRARRRHERQPRRRCRRRRTGRRTACPRRAGSAARRTRRHGPCRHELVEVLEALVVAGVDDGPTVGCFGDAGALVLERPSAVRLAGVELGSPGSISTTQPKRLGSFGLTARSKRGSALPPRVAAARRRRTAPSGRRREGRRRRAEVAVEVLLARQVGAPRRGAVGAVVDRPQHACARSGRPAVCSSGWPAAGPVSCIGGVGVDAPGEVRAGDAPEHLGAARSRMMLTPWACCALRTVSGRCSRPRSGRARPPSPAPRG